MRGTLRSLGLRWGWTAEGLDDAVLRARPQPTTWSLVEYAAHSAEVIEAHGKALHAMTTSDNVVAVDPPISATASADDPPTRLDFAEAIEVLEANALRYERLVARTPADAWARSITVGDEKWTADYLLRHTVHDASHHLSDAGRVLHALGAGAAPATGTVVGLFASGGGVPKQPLDRAEVGYRGVAGDVQHSRKHHGRVWQALCLWSAEVIAQLQTEGHSVRPGAAGENVTISGLNWSTLRPGVRLAVGDVLCEVSSYSPPCSKNAQWFIGGEFRRMDHDRHPGSSRVYASVLRDGTIRPGDRVVIEPE